MFNAFMPCKLHASLTQISDRQYFHQVNNDQKTMINIFGLIQSCRIKLSFSYQLLNVYIDLLEKI